MTDLIKETKAAYLELLKQVNGQYKGRPQEQGNVCSSLTDLARCIAQFESIELNRKNTDG